MSKTFKTDPAWVKADRLRSKAEPRHSYRCTAMGEPCDLDSRDGRCYWRLPRHVAAEPWHRRGTLVMQRRGRVKQALSRAVITANNDGDLEGLVMPDPFTTCLCYLCW